MMVHFECRNPDHLRGASRRGVGGLVIRHGSVGYCDGLGVDGAHHWVATGGVALEYLYRSASVLDGPGTSRASQGAHGQARPSVGGSIAVDYEGDPRQSADRRSGGTRSDDVERQPTAAVRITLVPRD